VKDSIGNSYTDYAEYYAVLLALQTLSEKFKADAKAITFELKTGSEFVKDQLSNERPINEPAFVPMFIEIHNLQVANFPHLKFTLIPSGENSEAERLVNETLDVR